MAQLMPLSLTISCSSKIQIGFTFVVPAHLDSPGQRAVKRVCVDCQVMVKVLGGQSNNQCMWKKKVKLGKLVVVQITEIQADVLALYL